MSQSAVMDAVDSTEVVKVDPVAPPPMTRGEKWKRRGPLLPALVFTLLLTQIPFLLTLIFSFQRWRLLDGGEATFNGGKNYVDVVQDPVFWRSVANTVVMTGGSTLACIIVGLIMAIFLNHAFPGRGIARTLAITPFFVMPVAATLFWKSAMFDPTFGFFGFVSRSLGLPAIAWLSEFPMAALVILLTWRFVPFAMLILIAGLQSAPQDQLEAAQMDGAGVAGRFRHVTLPHLRPFLELAALLLAMNLIQTFGEIALLTAGGPAYATTNITYYIFLTAFNAFDFGQASALGIVALVLTIALILPMLRLLSGIFQTEGRR
ncbi:MULTISPECIES: sugar ABC transporter permease [unclassified Microbacterium]|uniref:carbohydrate ABC transporter permease n=1 Tax=unclassified Microbacterium TaxID=2609290 RepID=UPI002579DE3D|nr:MULTISPECIES: sugar ABC transporter permease [unclassified Microbacterium]|tara:strand:- start:2767 stop:3723 length:957 start_codon:yes stop_codon:yes gene_type:complete